MNWKKKDAVLILTVLLIAGAAFGVHEFAGGDGADTVTVKDSLKLLSDVHTTDPDSLHPSSSLFRSLS